MSKLFIGLVNHHALYLSSFADRLRGLAWHTDDNALRMKFEEFGAVEEAVRQSKGLMKC